MRNSTLGAALDWLAYALGETTRAPRRQLRSALSVFKEHAQVWALAEQAEQRDVEAGEVFIQEGEEDEDLVLIEEGMAVVPASVGCR
ncbi:hypothetical protein AK812_SmicGene7244 [Symbiodinium microadriaticum]|uniref:Cyclic nucleotide-binding domain-containing protein n=1 Tax=Symbiodinium microadriaticum TaxID=2951 RepID=A0A1Q9EP76_SYMMI|nr:hypothetical protein AK812_SmicGene7244 [Symbiodinium microadriaticum]